MSYYDIDEKYNEEPSMAPPSYDDSVSVSIAPPSFDLTVEREQLALERLQLAEDRARLIEATKELARLRSELEEKICIVTEEDTVEVDWDTYSTDVLQEFIMLDDGLDSDTRLYIQQIIKNRRLSAKKINVSKIPEIMEYCYKALDPYYIGNMCMGPNTVPNLTKWMNTLDSAYVATYAIVWAYMTENASINIWTYIVTETQVFQINMSGIYQSHPSYSELHPKLIWNFSEKLSSTPVVKRMIESYAQNYYSYSTNERSHEHSNTWQKIQKQFLSLVHTIPGQKP